MPGMYKKRASEALTKSEIVLVSKDLRRRKVLDRDDQLIEIRQGKTEAMTADGVTQPLTRGKLPGRAGETSMFSYSSRRLYFYGPRHVVASDLEWVWRVEAKAGTISVVFTAPERMRKVRWQLLEGTDAAELATRVLAQRERRIVELPGEARQQASYWAHELDRRGSIEAELAAPVPEPRTVVGAWLKALVLRDEELYRELTPQLTRGQPGQGEDQAAVVAAAVHLMLARLFPPGSPPGAVEKFVADLAQHEANPGQWRADPARIEPVIRAGLGEPGITTDHIKRSEVLRIHLMTIALAYKQLGSGPAAFGLLVARSEQTAFDGGLHPPLLTEVTESS